VTFYNGIHYSVVVKLKKHLLSTGFSKTIQGNFDQITLTCPLQGTRKLTGPDSSIPYLIRNLLISMESIREKIETTKFHKFKNNGDTCLSCIEEPYENILDNHSTYNFILCYTSNALLSCPCLDFKTFVEAIKGNMDSGVGPHTKITFEKLVIIFRKKYLNTAVLNKLPVIDPKDAQLIILTTQL
jgi:hypothetical protein